MLSPQDIRNKTFNRTIRGYSPEEVDSYIDFLCEKFEDIYRENKELEHKLKVMTEQSIEKSEHDDIKQTLVLAQRAAEKITADAEKNADMLYMSAKNNTDKVLTEFREKIAKEAIVYSQLKQCVKELKESIYGIYRKNIEKIEDIAPTCEKEAELKEPETAEYIKMVVDGMKHDVAVQEQTEQKQTDDGRIKIRRSFDGGNVQKFRIASVKDTIKELNKKMLDGTIEESAEQNAVAQIGEGNDEQNDD